MKPAGHDPHLPLRVVPGRAGMTKTGFVRIAGEVVNESDRALMLPRVAIVLLDASGNPINVDSIAAAEGHGEGAVVDRGYIPPGERGFFTYTRDAKKLARPYASHQLSAQGLPHDGSRQAVLEGFTAEKDENGNFRVRGTLRSSGTLGCRSPSLVWGKFGADGLLIQSNGIGADAFFQKELAAGQTVAIEGKVYDHEKEVKELRAYGSCAHSD